MHIVLQDVPVRAREELKRKGEGARMGGEVGGGTGMALLPTLVLVPRSNAVVQHPLLTWRSFGNHVVKR